MGGLKACPFCGDYRHLNIVTSKHSESCANSSHIECTVCGSRGPTFWTFGAQGVAAEMAKENWNLIERVKGHQVNSFIVVDRPKQKTDKDSE